VVGSHSSLAQGGLQVSLVVPVCERGFADCKSATMEMEIAFQHVLSYMLGRAEMRWRASVFT